MTERERLAANERRLEWLDDARLGSVRITTPPQPKSAFSSLGLWRVALTAALLLGQRNHAQPAGLEVEPMSASATAR